MRVVFLSECGFGIGLGHVTRMSALSSFLASDGFEVSLRTYERQSENEALGDWLSDTSWMARTPADCVIVDSYLATEEHYTILRSAFARVVAIDDYNRMAYPADLVINPNVFFSSMDYSNQRARTIGGIGYLILRESFRRCKRRAVSGSGVLVTLGGSDFRALLPRLARLADRPGTMTIICPEENLRRSLQAQFPGLRICGRLTENEMLEEYLAAKTVVSGCGQSLHELAYLGVKTTGICLAPDQTLNQAYYVAQGFLRESIQWDDENLEDRVLLSIANPAVPGPAAPFDPERNLKNYTEALRAI